MNNQFIQFAMQLLEQESAASEIRNQHERSLDLSQMIQ